MAGGYAIRCPSQQALAKQPYELPCNHVIPSKMGTNLLLLQHQWQNQIMVTLGTLGPSQNSPTYETRVSSAVSSLVVF